MTTPVLYDYWRSSASYRVRLALALKGIAYTSIAVNLAGGEQSGPEHLARNPMAAVPVLDIDGLRLTQSLAIIEYLDETRAGIRLLPVDPAERAFVRSLALVIAADTHPLGNLATLNRIACLGGEVAKLDWARHHIARGLSAFETLLSGRDCATFCLGGAPGLADICLIPQFYNARRWGVDVAAFPRCMAIEEAFAALPAYSAAHPDRFAPKS